MYNGQVPILGWKFLNSVVVDEFHSDPEISHGDMWKRGTTWLDEQEYDIKVGLIKKSSIKNEKKQVETITLDTPLLECGFSFNTHFREYFSILTDVSPFKFTADMATAWRKVKRENDLSFTIQDMLKVYYGKSNYAKYDNSVCQWNQFLKDFCADKNSCKYSNKLKVASILWKEVRNSKNEKIYSKNLSTEYADKIKEYCR